MRAFVLLTAILIGAAVFHVQAADADPMLYPDASQRYAIDSGTIPLVPVAAGDLCDIQLQPGERINQAVISDSLRWKMTDGLSGPDIPHVFVKPTEQHLHALLTVTTTRRTYHVRLVSVGGAGQEFIGFYYPSMRVRPAQRVQQVAAPIATPTLAPLTYTCAMPLDSRYRVDGSAWFRPASVCNDGHHTYVNMGPIEGNLPVLVIVGDGNQDQIGNVTFDAAHSEYVLDGVPTKLALLRDGNRGQARVNIVRGAP